MVFRMLVNGNYSTGLSGITIFWGFLTPCSPAAGFLESVALSPLAYYFCLGLNPSTSCFNILPSGPDPFSMSLMFTPFYLASVLAAGLTNFLSDPYCWGSSSPLDFYCFFYFGFPSVDSDSPSSLDLDCFFYFGLPSVASSSCAYVFSFFGAGFFDFPDPPAL